MVHIPFGIVIIVLRNTHSLGSKCSEPCPLQRLGITIGPHLLCAPVFDGDVTIEHRGRKEMWADGNTEPLQGVGFRTFRSKAMGIPENYDDNAERARTHSMLLSKPDQAGMVPKKEFDVLAKVMGVERSSKDPSSGPTP